MRRAWILLLGAGTLAAAPAAAQEREVDSTQAERCDCERRRVWSWPDAVWLDAPGWERFGGWRRFGSWRFPDRGRDRFPKLPGLRYDLELLAPRFQLQLPKLRLDRWPWSEFRSDKRRPRYREV